MARKKSKPKKPTLMELIIIGIKVRILQLVSALLMIIPAVLFLTTLNLSTFVAALLLIPFVLLGWIVDGWVIFRFRRFLLGKKYVK